MDRYERIGDDEVFDVVLGSDGEHGTARHGTARHA